MSDKERLDIVEQKLVDVMQKLEIADIQLQRLLVQLAEMEAKLAQVNVRQERWLTLLGLTLADADQNLDLWQYPNLLRSNAEWRQN